MEIIFLFNFYEIYLETHVSGKSIVLNLNIVDIFIVTQ